MASCAVPGNYYRIHLGLLHLKMKIQQTFSKQFHIMCVIQVITVHFNHAIRDNVAFFPLEGIMQLPH